MSSPWPITLWIVAIHSLSLPSSSNRHLSFPFRSPSRRRLPPPTKSNQVPLSTEAISGSLTSPAILLKGPGTSFVSYQRKRRFFNIIRPTLPPTKVIEKTHFPWRTTPRLLLTVGGDNSGRDGPIVS